MRFQILYKYKEIVHAECLEENKQGNMFSLTLWKMEDLISILDSGSVFDVEVGGLPKRKIMTWEVICRIGRRDATREEEEALQGRM